MTSASTVFGLINISMATNHIPSDVVAVLTILGEEEAGPLVLEYGPPPTCLYSGFVTQCCTFSQGGHVRNGFAVDTLYCNSCTPYSRQVWVWSTVDYFWQVSSWAFNKEDIKHTLLSFYPPESQLDGNFPAAKQNFSPEVRPSCWYTQLSRQSCWLVSSSFNSW